MQNQNEEYIDRRSSTDKAFSSALAYCFAPLQNLAYAERALIFIDPYESWGMLFVRQGSEMLVYSTLNQQRARERNGYNYSLNSTESAIQGSENLEEAIYFLQDGISASPQQLTLGEGILLMASQILVMTHRDKFHPRGEKTDLDISSLEQRLKAYTLELLSEHLGIEVGMTVFSETVLQAFCESRALVKDQLSQFFQLKPLLSRSPYVRFGDQLNIEANTLT